MNIQDFFVDSCATVSDAIKVLDKMAKRIVLVTESNKLLGTITDGDFRRWILAGGKLSGLAVNIMNRNPICIQLGEEYKANEIFKDHEVDALPIIDSEGNVVNMFFYKEELMKKHRCKHALNNIPVVIMAGGKGTRLHPYTKVLPKPLIPIGEKTIIDRIIDRFCEFGCNEFYITVNYKKNMIKAYLDDQHRDIKINYIEEDKFLGTAGSLSLIREKIKGTFILSNCDILVDANYEELIQHHKDSANKITIVSSLKRFTVPYGVIDVIKGGGINKIIEKPEFSYQVNTGVYVLEPEVLYDVPEDKFYNMTELLDKYIVEDREIGIYPITSNCWSDMGEISEMEGMLKQLEIN